MLKALIIADENRYIWNLSLELAQEGLVCSVVPDGESVAEQITEKAPDLMLIAIDGSSPGSGMWHLGQKIRQESKLPIISLISRETLASIDRELETDDFVVEPWDAAEVAMRARRTLQRTKGRDGKELIKCGDLVIDLGRCETSIDGRLVALTFREYELLRFLASNKGKVFTREALLDRVWGYDYYGGDRTVDVYIRRLRSKIENFGHTFIETVRNIGYRFCQD